MVGEIGWVNRRRRWLGYGIESQREKRRSQLGGDMTPEIAIENKIKQHTEIIRLA